MREFAVAPSEGLSIEPGGDRGAAYVVLYGDGQKPRDWLRAGEALSSVLLTATSLGLSVAPISDVIESDDTRELVRGLPNGPGHPYVVIRIGMGPSAPDLEQAPRLCSSLSNPRWRERSPEPGCASTEGVRLVVRAEPPGELLVDVANWSDLLVVGAPADPGLLERGSTTHHVVRHARCPVVVVRSCLASGTMSPRGPFRGHVDVGADGSASARAALEFGFLHAAGHRQPLVAVYATPRGVGDLWFDETLLETHLTAEPAALTLLAEEVEPWHHKYPDVAVKRAVFVGRPLEALLRASSGATLLIVGRSRQGRNRRRLGSVAHGAIDRAPCPRAVVAGDSTTEEAGPWRKRPSTREPSQVPSARRCTRRRCIVRGH